MAASFALLAAGGTAGAAPKRITGKLSERGYTVIALPAHGPATLDRAKGGDFSLRAPAESVTLHLRAKDGTYAGPVVVDRKHEGERAIVGVKAGAELGRIEVDTRKGYAKAKRRLPKDSIAPELEGRAKHGVPIGAAVFGRVRSKRTHGGVPGDRDLDAIPGALDISDDGDLVLDNFERSKEARAAQAEGPGAPIYLESHMALFLQETVNANAAALTVGDIDKTLVSHGGITLDGPAGYEAELDCGGLPDPNNPNGWIGGLTYCTRGGTGRWATQPFPECCDPDRDGLGALGSAPGALPGGFNLQHGATTAQIRTGDVLIERVTKGVTGADFPPGDYSGTLQFVFAAVPALVSYSDTAGNSATVSYPVAAPGADCSPPGCPGGPGTEGNGFPVSAPPGKDIKVTLTFWRPQRTPIPPETAEWMDIGGLAYRVTFPEGNTTGSPGGSCPERAFTAPGSELTPTTDPDGGGVLADSAPDRAADPQNTFAYTVNLTECLRDPQGFGASTEPLTWKPGQERALHFEGSNLLDSSTQIVYFKLAG